MASGGDVSTVGRKSGTQTTLQTLITRGSRSDRHLPLLNLVGPFPPEKPASKHRTRRVAGTGHIEAPAKHMLESCLHISPKCTVGHCCMPCSAPSMSRVHLSGAAGRARRLRIRGSMHLSTPTVRSCPPFVPNAVHSAGQRVTVMYHSHTHLRDPPGPMHFTSPAAQPTNGSGAGLQECKRERVAFLFHETSLPTIVH